MSKYALLSPMSSNAKTTKMLTELGIDGVILYLAPASVSGVINVCPMASPGCGGDGKDGGPFGVCLNTAGRGGLQNVQDARIRRTKLFKESRQAFLALMVRDLECLVHHTSKSGLRPVARLNGTSDLSYERFKVVRGQIEYPNIFAAFPEVQFYDYTKVVNRLERVRDIPNYSLTFSLSESNDQHAQRALELGFNVAAVIKDPGATWSGIPVIDGDTNDFRFLDPRGGHIVALKAKGKARSDTSGFVRSADDHLDITRTPVFARAA